MRMIRAICVLALPFLSAGCVSFSYVDANNSRHIVGFVDLKVEPNDTQSAKSEPSVQSVTSLGLYFYSGGANGSGVVLGYAKETTVLVPNNSCVSLDLPGSCPSPSPSSSFEANAGKPKS
jgi:hypothetical protein